MSSKCRECGAAIPSGGSCRDNLNSLLALEWDSPGGAGQIAHFYAVSTYILQHPDDMAYTVESLLWLRSALSSALVGQASIHDLRLGAQGAGKAVGRVTRRVGDPVPRWSVRRWSIRVTDVLKGGVDGYCRQVKAWAGATIDDLDATDA